MPATEKDIRKALRKVKDPELNLDIVVLGLVYDLDVNESHVNAKISLTSPFCPAANQIIDDAKAAIEGVEGVDSAEVELTFDPPWTPERIDPLIRATLGI
jgi:metal-sulfur cluster biosynthetic enzyme